MGGDNKGPVTTRIANVGNWGSVQLGEPVLPTTPQQSVVQGFFLLYQVSITLTFPECGPFVSWARNQAQDKGIQMFMKAALM